MIIAVWGLLFLGLLLVGLLLAGGLILTALLRPSSHSGGHNFGGWRAGMGLGAGTAVGLVLLFFLLFAARWEGLPRAEVATPATEARSLPPMAVPAPEAPVLPIAWQPAPPLPVHITMHSGVALMPVVLIAGMGLVLILGFAVALAARTRSAGPHRSHWGPLLGAGFLLLIAAAAAMWFVAIPVRVANSSPTGAPTWARLVLFAGIVIVPLVVAGAGAILFRALRPANRRNETASSFAPSTSTVSAWRLGLNGLALAIVPAAAVWGGSLVALQATPHEAVEALGTTVLGIPSAAEQVRQASLVGKERLPTPTDARSATADTLPEWIQAPEVHSGSRQRRILASRLYTSVAEAERELLAETSNLVRDDLRQHVPLARQATLTDVSGDTLRTLVVTNQHTQTEEKDFGTFAAPMQRVWWEVQFDDQTRDNFLPSIRHEIARGRLLVGVWALALATLIVGCYLAFIQSRQLTSPDLPASLMTA